MELPAILKYIFLAVFVFFLIRQMKSDRAWGPDDDDHPWFKLKPVVRFALTLIFFATMTVATYGYLPDAQLIFIFALIMDTYYVTQIIICLATKQQ